MNRRGFMQAILAAGVAPYVVTTSGVLMPIKQRIAPLQLYISGSAGQIVHIFRHEKHTNVVGDQPLDFTRSLVGATSFVTTHDRSIERFAGFDLAAGGSASFIHTGKEWALLQQWSKS